MKKIYFLLAAMFGLFFSTNMYAQFDEAELENLSRGGYTVDPEEPLILDVWEQLYGENGELNPCCDSGEGSEWALLGETKPDEVSNRNTQDFWHSNWHNGDQPAGSHYLQVKMTDELDSETLIAFVFKRRNANNDHTTKWSVMGTDDPEADKSECEELAYIETPFGNNTETLMSTVFKRSGYQYLRFYSEEQYPNTRGYFHMARFQIYKAMKMEENVAAYKDLEAVYEQYQPYEDQFEGRLGDQPGDYSQDAFDAFTDALGLFYEMDDVSNTVEELTAVKDSIINTYNALMATKVPFLSQNLPGGSGYYRIRAGMVYDTGDKYMLGYRADGKLWGIWATPDFDLPEDNIQALWKITAVTDTTYDIQNMYHQGRFMKVERSKNVEMSDAEAYKDSLLTFDAAFTDHDMEISYVNIRLDAQAANDFFYLHQGGHSNGAGDNGYLVGWSTSVTTDDMGYPSARASEWWLEEVPEDEALEIIANFDNEEDVMKAELKVMLDKAPGMIEIAKDIKTNLEEDKPVVSDENPITSPCSDSAEGQHIEYLWDDDTNTFWHSDWHGAYTNEDHHYIQIEIPDDLTSAAFRFTRRKTDNNHITKWSVYGADEDDFDLVQADLEKLGEFNTPYGTNTETLTSGVFQTNGHKYIRFYCEATSASGNSKFFHASEFQLYPGELIDSPTSQYHVMGDIATNLEQLVAELNGEEGYDYEAFKKEDYERLKAAYDAFTAIYVNPAALRDTIALAETKAKTVVEGTDPGFWPIGTATALNKLIADAKAYDVAGAYTPAKSEEFNAALNAQMEGIDGKVNTIKTGKWYRLRFGTEAEYDQYKWSKDGNAANYWIDKDTDPENPDTLGMYNAGNFGKYIAVAKRENVVLGQNNENNDVNGSLIKPISKDSVYLGKSIHGIDLAELDDADMALFRFVSVGDSAFAIQNKATGLFIDNGGSLNVQPGLFTQHASGYGQNAFFNKSIVGKDKAPLHLAQSQTVLCAWGNNSGSGWTDADGRRGSFFVEEVADVAADYTFGDFQMNFTPGDIYGRCFPVPVTLKNDDVTLWSIANIERTPDGADAAVETVKVTFAKVDTSVPVIAGRPFFIVAKGEMPEEEEEYEDVIAKFAFTFDLINTPQTTGYLKGAFDDTTISERFLTTGTGHGQDALAWKTSGSNVSANRVYITDIAEGAEEFKRKAVLEIVFDEAIEDGVITSAIQNISRNGGIYTIDGRLVRNGNMNDMQNLPKGLYILNGTKVLVK